jgi:hypothetical protein
MAHMGEERNAYSFSWGKLRARDHLEDLDLNERIIKMDFEEMEWDAVGRIDLAQDKGMCQTCEHDNEPLDSIKCGEFFDWLNDC